MNRAPARLPYPVGEEAETPPAADMLAIEVSITGEMALEDVPAANHIDIGALKAGDASPLEVIVSVPVGKSKRDWYYTAHAISSIVGEVNTNGLPGFLGHQKPDNVGDEFPHPVTHWVGAKFVPTAGEQGVGYFRGVVDASAADLKRWIRAKAINTVSIYGVPELKKMPTGETHVVDYRPMSIDWTPRGRAGMPTRVEAIGEMDSLLTVPDSTPSGKAPAATGVENMTLAEVLAELRKLNVRPKDVVGEMRWTPDGIAKDLNVSLADFGRAYDPHEWEGIEADRKLIKETAEAAAVEPSGELAIRVRKMRTGLEQIATALGAPDDATLEDILALVRSARKAQVAAIQKEQMAVVDRVIGEMVTAEPARPIVRRMLQLGENPTEEQIKTAVGELLQSEEIKTALGALFTESAIRPNTGNTGDAGRGKPDVSRMITRRVALG